MGHKPLAIFDAARRYIGRGSSWRIVDKDLVRARDVAGTSHEATVVGRHDQASAIGGVCDGLRVQSGRGDSTGCGDNLATGGGTDVED